MNWISRDQLGAVPLIGTFLGIGSAISAEIAAKIGFDWVLVDTEHGAGDEGTLVQQLQAISGGTSSPIVRVPWNDPVVIKRTLDAGASGIMVPYVNSATEAKNAVAAVKYPPQGIRGTARSTRAAGFGIEFEQYFAVANEKSMVIVQIETPDAVANATEIAAVEGVDVLFVGPLDLRVNLGWPDSFDQSEFDESIRTVVRACTAAGKTAGILSSPAEARDWIRQGLTFLAIGSDGMALVDGLRSYLASAQPE